MGDTNAYTHTHTHIHTNIQTHILHTYFLLAVLLGLLICAASRLRWSECCDSYELLHLLNTAISSFCQARLYPVSRYGYFDQFIWMCYSIFCDWRSLAQIVARIEFMVLVFPLTV